MEKKLFIFFFNIFCFSVPLATKNFHIYIKPIGNFIYLRIYFVHVLSPNCYDSIIFSNSSHIRINLSKSNQCNPCATVTISTESLSNSAFSARNTFVFYVFFLKGISNLVVACITCDYFFEKFAEV